MQRVAVAAGIASIAAVALIAVVPEVGVRGWQWLQVAAQKSRILEPATPMPTHNIGNGFAVALGETWQSFKDSHPAAECPSSGSAIVTVCKIDAPEPSDCPSSAACASAVYFFTDQRLDGFWADYVNDIGLGILAETSKTFGKPSTKRILSVGTLTIHQSIWDMTNGYHLTIAHLSGTNDDGSQPSRQYRVTYSQGYKSGDNGRAAETDEWWVYLEDPKNITCERTLVTYKQTLASVRQRTEPQYVFTFENVKPIPTHFGVVIMVRAGKGHKSNVLIVDGPPYRGSPPFGRLFVFSNNKADCLRTIPYVHYLLGY